MAIKAVQNILKNQENKNYYHSKLMDIYPLSVTGNIRNYDDAQKAFDMLFKKDTFDDPLVSLSDFFSIVDNHKLQFNAEASLGVAKNARKEVLRMKPEKANEILQRYKSIYNIDKSIFMSSFIGSMFSSRNTGPMFQNYIKEQDNFVALDDFAHAGNDVITTAGDKTLQKYVKENYGINLKKGIDAIGKSASGKVFIFEAKIITRGGGSQNHQMRNALDVASINENNVQGVAVLDGNFVVDESNNEFPFLEEVDYNSTHVISAVEIQEFLHTH